MSKAEKISIAFDNRGRIPVGVMGNKDIIEVPPHKEIKVPKTYGDHLIRDRLAYDPDVRKAEAQAADVAMAERVKRAETAAKVSSKETADLEARIKAKTAELDKANAEITDLKAKLAEAEKSQAETVARRWGANKNADEPKTGVADEKQV